MTKIASPAAPPAQASSSLLTGLTMAIAGAVLFSAKAVVAKLMYRYNIDAITVIALRMIFSFPVFAAIAVWKMRTEAPLSNADRWRLFGLGMTGYYIASVLDFMGLQYISVGLERLILFLSPTFVVLMTAFYFKRAISRVEWIALALSYCGIVLVFMHDLRIGGNTMLGALLVLGSALTYGIYLLGSGEMVKRIGTTRLVSYAMCVSSVAGILQFFVLRPASLLIQPAPVYWLSLVIGVFCTIMPVFLTMMGVRRIGAATASQAGMVGPVSTLFMGALVLAEPITGVQIAGTVLVLSGIAMLSKKK
ncbi:MAG: DMT family transporter [Massilia sp.]